MSNWSITFQQKTMLIKALINCPSMRNSREAVVSQLPNAINIPFDPRIDIHTLNIVDACLNYYWGIESLIDIIRFFDEGTTSMYRLYAVINYIRPQPIALAHVVPLRDALSTISIADNVLRKFYVNSIPPGIQFPENYSKRSLLSCMIDLLALLPQNKQGHPLLLFAKQIEQYIHEITIRKAVRRWIDIIVQKYDYKKPEDDFLSIIENISWKKMYLLIELEPSIIEVDSYLIRAWIWSERRKQLIFVEDTPRKMNIIPDIIGDIFENKDLIIEQIATESELIVEFFLPASLLALNVDQWIVDKDDNMPIGWNYCTVVRLRERVYNPKYWPAWRLRWRKVNPDVIMPHHLIEEFHKIDKITDNVFRFRLEEAVCCIFTSIPSKASYEYQFVFSTILKSGTPIALLIRDLTQPTNHIQEIINEIVGGGILSELPERLRRKRRQYLAHGQGQNNNSFALLWDDPNRIPPELNLEAPK